MRLVCCALGCVCAVLVAAGAAIAQTLPRFEAEVAAYEAADRTAPPPQGEIVFVGSSSIYNWNLAASFPDLKTINRGIRGSEMVDAVRFVDRLVTPHAPRLVVVYAGDNDISAGWTSESVVVEFERFVRAVHAKLPASRILYIGIKPSLLRWTQIDRMRAANAMIRTYCERDERLAYVDVDNIMLGWDEKPRPELFVADGLHMTAEGYRLWTAVVRPMLGPPTLVSAR